MTTAKPEPMAGQPDEHDDLIAELAKLMAQDDQGSRPAPPAAPQPPAPAFQAARPAPQPPTPQPAPFQVRIPGGDTPAQSFEPSPNPRFDFGRDGQGTSPVEPAPRSVEPTARHEPIVPRQEPITPRPAPAAPRQEAPPRPEPSFVPPQAASQQPVRTPPVAPAPSPQPEPNAHFDLDLGIDQRGPTSPIPPRSFAPPSAPVPPRAEPEFRARVEPQLAAQAPRPAPTVQQPIPVAPAPVAPPQADPHDSIADLIAAEFFNDSAEQESPQDEPYVDTDEVPPAAPAPEPDRFDIPPVFGLGGPSPQPAPAVAQPVPVAIPPAAPRAAEPFAPVSRAPSNAVRPQDDDIGLDPIDEIENLIGRAGQVERNPAPVAPPVAERPAPSAALRSLATPTMPANPAPPPRAAAPIPRSARPNPRQQHTGADEAILAAAAATGADVGWVHSPQLEDPEQAYAEPAQRAPRGFRLSRRVAAPIVALTLLGAAGFGLYWVLGNAAPSGPAPLLTADSTPVKETPTVDPAASTPNQSVVFNEIDGVQPGADEQLVSRDQADVNEVTQVPPPETSDEGLANRKVRTVTVRPDGTIVSSDDSVAGSSMLPVVRPNVPAVPGAQTASSALTTASAEQPLTTPPATTPQPITPPPATVTPVQAGATVPAVDAAGAAIPGKTTVIPLAKPSSFRPQPTGTPPATSVNAIIQQAPASATPTPTPAPEAGSVQLSNAPAYVQLASHRTEAEARQSANTIVSRFGPLFKGANLEVQRIELGDRGIYYRVRVPADSLQSANDLCAQVKAAGGDCFAM